MRLGIILLILSSLVSCQWFQTDEEKDPVVARVDDHFLYTSDLAGLNSTELSTEDSIQITKNYIDNWIKQQLVLRKAELNLSDTEKDVEELVERYKNSLLRNKYESMVIDQYLDTLVSDEEVQAFYETHLADFELKENILRFKLVKIDQEAPNQDELRELFPPEDEDEEMDLEDYVIQFANQSFLKDSVWIGFDELKDMVPLWDVNEVQFLRDTETIELKDSIFVYLLHISEYRIEKSYSPVSYVEGMIRKLILHQRKLDLITKMEDDLYRDGADKGLIEIYE